MIGTILSVTETKINKTPAIEMSVRKANGEVKTYKVPKFKEEICKTVEENNGGVVDITFEKTKAGFINVAGVKKVDEAELTKAEEKAKSSENTGASGSSSTRGTSGRNWVPDPNKDRGVALRYAVDASGPLGKKNPVEYAAAATELADLFLEYITTGNSGDALIFGRTTETVSEDVPEPDVEG